MQPAERDFGYMAGAISDWVHANTVQTIRATNLATALLGPVTANHSLGKMPGPGRVAAKEIYAALDGPGCEQSFIEANWSAATSRTAHCCCTMSPPPISKDAVAKWRSMATAATTVVTGRRVVIGLTATADGRPVAVEVFEGNTADPVTLSWAFSPRVGPAGQIDKLKQRFHLRRLVTVDDCGVLTGARIGRCCVRARPVHLAVSGRRRGRDHRAAIGLHA